MNVLSLFDGCSGARLALVRANKKVDQYFTCEIDKYAQQVTKLNFPDSTMLGDVIKVNFEMLPKIDFLVGGSPCQDLSFAKGNGKGLEGERSGLFYKYFEALEVLRKKNPEIKFLFENVKMKQEWKDIISDKLGVQPIFINSADFSAQNRQRLYWTNITIDSWSESNVKLKDILEDGQVDRDKSHCLDANYFKGGNLKSYFEKHRRQLVFIEPNFAKWRNLTPLECERLQTVPDNYTKCGQKDDGEIVLISNTQRYKMLGNGFTINVIAHILKSL